MGVEYEYEAAGQDEPKSGGPLASNVTRSQKQIEPFADLCHRQNTERGHF